MKVKIAITSKRGGQRNVKPRKLSTSRVLDYLFKQYGGTFKLAEELKIHSQMVSKWISQGYVPMKWVGPVSRLIKAPKALLNYEGFVSYTGNQTTWKHWINNNVFLNAVEKLLSGKQPRTPKEILG